MVASTKPRWLRHMMRHAVALADAELAQGVGQRRSTGSASHRRSASRARRPDRPGAARARASEVKPPAGPGAPLACRVLAERASATGRVGPDDPGTTQHLRPTSRRAMRRRRQLLEHGGRPRACRGRSPECSAGLGRDQTGGGPVLADRRGRRLREPGDRGGLGDVGGVDGVGSADLGRQQPDRPAADEVGERSPPVRRPGRRRRRATRAARRRPRCRSRRRPCRRRWRPRWRRAGRRRCRCPSRAPGSTMPDLKPRRSAGPWAGPWADPWADPVWVVPPPAVALTRASSVLPSRHTQRRTPPSGDSPPELAVVRNPRRPGGMAQGSRRGHPRAALRPARGNATAG